MGHQRARQYVIAGVVILVLGAALVVIVPVIASALVLATNNSGMVEYEVLSYPLRIIAMIAPAIGAAFLGAGLVIGDRTRPSGAAAAPGGRTHGRGPREGEGARLGARR